MMLSRIKDRWHGKARGLILTKRENRSFSLADESCVCHLKFLNHLINYFSKNWHINEKLRGNCSQLLALFEHYFENLSTSWGFWAIFFASTFSVFPAQSGKTYIPFSSRNRSPWHQLNTPCFWLNVIFKF